MQTQKETIKQTGHTIKMILMLIGFAVALITLGQASASANTITVTSASDGPPTVDGVVTLREAMMAANTNAPSGDAPAGDAGLDVINFNIPVSGVQTINLTSALPTITEPIKIDGYTQPGAKANTLAVGSDAVLLIELNGANAGANASGLTLNADNSTIKGLVVNRFALFGIYLQTNGNNTVAGNFIGTNAGGTAAYSSPNDNVGVLVKSINNIIGGTTAADRNVISGNGITGPGGTGVWISGISATGNKVLGNYIGTDASGTAAIPNLNNGIFLVDCKFNIVGGTTPAERNVISRNGSNGLTLGGIASNNQVMGNYIGIRADGVGQLKNNFGGITFANTASNNTIGGTSAGAGNIIAFNNGQGIFVGTTNVNNAILGNSIFGNGSIGIDLYNGVLGGVTPNDDNTGDADTGANNLQNYPVLNSAVASNGTTTIKGTLDSAFNTAFRIEVFSNTQADSSGFGEGEKFLGFVNATTDASGKASFTFNVPTASVVGSLFSATATDPSGNTSEFAASISGAVNNPGTLQFSVNQITQFENSGSFKIDVTRTNGSAGTVTVQYATNDANAKAPADYTQTSGTLTFLNGETLKTITIPIVDDATPEGYELFELTLNNPTNGATLGGNTHASLIIQDNEKPTLSINDVSVKEGDAGTTSETFTVTLSDPIANQVAFDYETTAGGTATSGVDYQPASGHIVINPGEVSRTINVQVVSDTQVEPDETFIVQLKNPEEAIISKAQGAGTITNDDAAPPVTTVQLEQSTYAVSEGAHYKQINVTRTGDVSAAASVDYATSDMSASQRTDYNIMLGTLSFAAGESARTLTLLVTEDSYVEGDESLTLTLSNPVGMTLGAQSVAQITISDNDSNQNVPNAIDDVQNFVRQQYHDFLNREPDSAGFQGWQDSLNNCAPGDTKCDRIEVSAGFYRSPEFQERGYFIYRFYSASFGRKPDYSEFMRDISNVSGFLTDAEKEARKVAFIAELMNRQEFRNKYDSTINNPAAYVDGLLQTAGLPNHPSRAGWVAGLTNNTLSRAQVLRELAESSEVQQKFYNEAFVVMQYFGYLRRDPDILYLDWIKIINQNGGAYRGMIDGFMNSLEYRQRFGN
ncbi:MAG TPA: Calx-beta domain-containing protein [Pyrinomonadaceae bacterium]|nr:Calx-beta domain-containing protein [Pyrinomonadaceae bacterium]